MSNQQPPYNPFMFPFPFHYPPPPFMSPMMPPQPRNPLNVQPGEMMPSQKQFPIHPFGYPPFPMMYPPPIPQYYPFYDQKVCPKDIQFSNPLYINKEPFQISQQSKKIKTGETSQANKKQSSIIVLSDDEEKYHGKRRNAHVQKHGVERNLNQQKDLSFQPKPRRTIRKIVAPAKQDPAVHKARVQQKKKDLGLQQKKNKIQKLENKEVKTVAETTIENHPESFSRSTRGKFLTAKDGKGKIMIGEEFQANLPIFLPRNEILTIWVDQRKNGLLSRFIK